MTALESAQEKQKLFAQFRRQRDETMDQEAADQTDDDDDDVALTALEKLNMGVL